ncbi:TetR/AcrR family transcriptional regulator [Pelagibius sp.]|uniref:TetR/AcrR family transcriptional regulator n=1 Tax=Pelagibius sp. TaxID=1931238 RepID=UPI002619BC6B|nr:TetR/AcrR family transcriptional regulator [Pelagibius sp.]
MSQSITDDSLLTESPEEALKTKAQNAPSPKQQAIVAAAAELFLHQGYGAVSMDAIAAKAEVSKRTVYSHFPGKDALFAAVMMDHCDSVAGIGHLELDAAGDPYEVLIDLGCRFLPLVTSAEAVALFRIVVAEAGRFPELGQTFFHCGPLRWVATVAPYLAEQHRKGRLELPDAEAAAAQFMNMLKDPLHMRSVLGVQQQVTEAEIEAHVRRSVEDFLKLHQPA